MMHRQEQIGDCTLILGDCRDVLQDIERADALITDPVWPNCPADLILGSDGPAGLWRDAWAVMPDVTRAVVVMRHDSDPRFLGGMGGLPYTRATILPYVIPGYIGRLLGGDELAYCFGPPIPSKPGQRVIPGRAPSVQPDGRKANGHPCSRALGHFRFLVRWWSQPGEVALDPFMGSGTTGVACALEGRRFIGVEIHESYFEIACRRIEEAYRQGDLVVAAERMESAQSSFLEPR
jgi:DNA modification methylase